MHRHSFSFSLIAVALGAACALASIAAVSPALLTLSPFRWIAEGFAREASSSLALLFAFALLAAAVLISLARTVWIRAGAGTWMLHGRASHRLHSGWGAWAQA